MRLSLTHLLAAAILLVAATRGHAQTDVFMGLSAPPYAGIGSYTTVTLKVYGSAVGKDVTLTYAVPAGLTFNQLPPSSGIACTTPPRDTNGTVTCHTTELNGMLSQKVIVNVPAGTAPGTIITHQANANPSYVDPLPDNNTATITQTAQPLPDIYFTSTFPPTFVGGEPIAYTFTVHNRGNVDAQKVSVIDYVDSFFPQGYFTAGATQLSGPPFECHPTYGTVTGVVCEAPTFGAGQTASFAATMNTLPASYLNPMSHKTQLTQQDFVGGFSFSQSASPSQQVVDLLVTSGAPPQINPGGDLAYSVHVRNAGPSATGAVTTTWTTPPGTTFLSLTSTGVFCTTPAVGAAGTITCTQSGLAPAVPAVQMFEVDQSLTIHLRAPSVTGAVTNSVSATTANDVTPLNNTSSVTTLVAGPPSADLAVTLQAPVSSSVINTAMGFAMTVRNDGPTAATNVTATFAVPSGMSSSSLAAGCAGIPVTCIIGTLASGASRSLTVGYLLSAAGTLTATVTVTSDLNDPNPSNNSASASVVVRQATSDLALTLTSVETTVRPQQPFEITAWIQGSGPDPIISDLSVLFPPFTLIVIPPGCNQTSSTTLLCTGYPWPGSPVTTTFDFMAPLTPGPLPFLFTLTTPDRDPNLSNNSASITVTVPGPTLGLSFDPPSVAVIPGLPFAFTIHVTNEGSQALQPVDVSDTLPTGMSLVSATPSSGTCTGSSIVTCRVDALNSGETMSIRVIALPPLSGSLINQATAISGSASASADLHVDVVPTSRRRAAGH
jgi:uncharacterized repeat protein (TIGR01451 family)